MNGLEEEDSHPQCDEEHGEVVGVHDIPLHMESSPNQMQFSTIFNYYNN